MFKLFMSKFQRLCFSNLRLSRTRRKSSLFFKYDFDRILRESVPSRRQFLYKIKTSYPKRLINRQQLLIIRSLRVRGIEKIT